MADENQVSSSNDFQDEEAYAEAISKEMLEEQKQLADAMRLPQAPIDSIIKEVLPAGMHVSKVISLKRIRDESFRKHAPFFLGLSASSSSVWELRLTIPQFRLSAREFLRKTFIALSKRCI